MTFKKTILLIIAMVSALSLSAKGFGNDKITMLVIPRETLPLQIGQDISRRYPVLLVSYQMVRGSLKIDAWDGDNWVYVPVEDYTSGTFFTNCPKVAVVVENEKVRAPDVLTPDSRWCESAYRLTSTDPRVMLHLLGVHFDFPFGHWDQMAKRYGYELEEINPALENVHWWDLRGDVYMKKMARRDFYADMNRWQPLETVPIPANETGSAIAGTPKTTTKPEATAVDITVKAAKEPPAPAPAAKPAPQTKPAPVIEKAPEAPPVELSVKETVTAVETVTATTNNITAATEETVTNEDPFEADDVPAAEIVVPVEQRNTGRKLF
jgi:hypothetical protein